MNIQNDSYVVKKLDTSPKYTLIVLDWDDTLCPTTWMIENNINPSNPQSILKYTKYFNVLDESINDLLNELKKHGNVAIITNAMSEWIHLASSILPHTNKQISNNVQIISARQKYQNNVANPNDWKKYAFKDLLKQHEYTLHNIVSIGDAEYEYNALIDLWKYIPHKYLKSIKFIKSPSESDVIVQLRLMRKHVYRICSAHRQFDLLINDQ